MVDQSAAVMPLQRPKDVSVNEIEQELDKIWSSKGENVAARAATFNFLVYESLDDTAALAPSSTVDTIATQNPCRVIEMRAKREGKEEDPVVANVAAYCPVTRDRSSLICCEYITLQAPEAGFLRMSNTVGSLLIHELPTILWWQGDLDLGNQLFQQMVGLSNRVIVDSRSFNAPEEDLDEIHQLISAGRHCSDLNWQRLGPWQELTAQAFDPPDRRESITKVDRITLDYNADNITQALLALGWISSRLGWQPEQRTRVKEHDYLIDRITLKAPDGRVVEAELAAVPLASETTPPGDLIGLRLTSTDINADACTVLCSETTGCMRMESMGGAQSCTIRQVSPMEHESVEDLLTQQLNHFGPDQLYEESLAVAIQIMKVSR